MIRKFFPLACLLLIAPLSGCSQVSLWGLEEDPNRYQGPQYQPVTQCAVIFHPSQAGPTCQVIGHSLVGLPAGSTGPSIRDQILAEARSKGANEVLIGQSKQSNMGDEPQFLYYGPEQPYSCGQAWDGFRYGFSTWEKQGDWVNLGYREWGRDGFRVEMPIVIQVALLRCP